MNLGSLCSGIGGLDLGLEHGLGASTVWQVEQSEYCRRVLARHWPNAQRFDDVHSVGAANLLPVGVICGGFPCQPSSFAGKHLAQSDPRWLWPEVARIVAELRPAVCVFENVLGLRTAGLRDVLRDLAALGFDAEWATSSAAELGGPHWRRRIFIVASDPMRVELRQQPGWLGRALERSRSPIPRDTVEALLAADPDGLRRLEQAWRLSTERGWPIHRGWRFDSTPRVDDVPTRGLVGAMRKAAGNAVVTACAFVVGRAAREAIEWR